jgi:hypothetical protein
MENEQEDNYRPLPGETLGELAAPVCEVPTDVWRKVVGGERPGFLKRERYRTRKEICDDLLKHIDCFHCPECHWEKPRKSGEHELKCAKCGHDCCWYIDEYFSVCAHGPTGLQQLADKPVGPIARILCFAVTGGSEGHYVHIGCTVPTIFTVQAPPGSLSDTVEEEFPVYQEWAIIKTFRGMDHAYNMAARCAKLLGA